MRKVVMKIFSLAFAVMLLMPFSKTFAATDGFYDLAEITYTWDGTDADRTRTSTADYNYSYGDEANLEYALPWPFIFYDQTYNQVNIDSNGNIWFTYNSSAHSSNLANPGKGPVISIWNNDLSSHYYGGFFIQHKTNPERVVIEWQTESYKDEGTYLLNNFEAVLYPNGVIRFDYKTFDPNMQAPDDFGSGISKDNNGNYLSISNVFTLQNRSYRFDPYPDISVIPTSDSFGNVYVGNGTSSSIRTYTVRNIANGNLNIGTIAISGGDRSMFTKVSDSCSGMTLAPSAACTTQLKFIPTSIGGKTAELWIPSNDHDTPTLKVPLNGTGVYPTLTINTSGFGSGTVTITPPGTTCGLTCTATYTAGSAITLSASPGSGTTFAGWTGACTGTVNPCALNVNSDTSVTANFGCINAPVRIAGKGTYSTLQAAYNTAVNGDVIQAQALTFIEPFTASRSISATIEGGYNCTYSLKIGYTTLKGSQVNISGGTATIKDVVIDK